MVVEAGREWACEKKVKPAVAAIKRVKGKDNATKLEWALRWHWREIDR